MNTFKKEIVSSVEWDGAARSHNVTFWCADGDGFVTVLSNAHHNALFDQGDFVAWLPKNLTHALEHATLWLANEYPEMYKNIKE
jgi:hypothetical protein